MSTEIYYFSGTGNSLYIAKELAARTQGKAIPIAAFMDGETVQSEADTIGIVFPVYYTELPVIIKKFAGKLKTQGAYVFAVCNFGGAAGASLKLLKRMLKENGIELSAGFGVHMPQNAFKKPWEDREKVYKQSARRIDFIAEKIKARKKGIYYTNIPLEIMMALMHPLVRSACEKDFMKRTGAPAGTDMDVLINLLGKSFSANENCTGCGTCERVCPAGNIKIENGRPVWMDACENCLACYNWCPAKAVTGGISKGYYYRHPEIKASEIAGKG